MKNILTNTLLANALAVEIGEMGKLVTDEKVTDMYDKDGGISIPTNATLTRPSLKGKTTIEYGNLYNQINHDCVNVELTLKDSLKMLSNLINSDVDGTIYGAIWVSASNSNTRLNLLHPVIVDAVIKGLIAIPIDHKGRLYVYSYTDKFIKAYSGTVSKDLVTLYVPIWNNVMDSLSEAYQPVIGHRLNTSTSTLIDEYRRGRPLDSIRAQFRADGNNPRQVVTPVHMFTRDMLFPYYGVVLSEYRDGSGYVSRDLTPMGSCNVSHGGDITAWGSTCTGGQSNAVYASLRTLCNANTHSPFHLDAIEMDYTQLHSFVKITQDLACVIIDTAYPPEPKVEEQEEVSTDEPVEKVSEPTDGNCDE